MATPATLKQIEKEKERAANRRKREEKINQQQLRYSMQSSYLSGGMGGWAAYPGQGYGDHGYFDAPQQRYSGQHQYSAVDFTTDAPVPIPQQPMYTSFERLKAGAAHKPQPLLQQRQHSHAKVQSKKEWEKLMAKVESPPADMRCVTVKVDEKTVVAFGGRQHWLSNFYPAPMNVDGHDYPTVEHYYQACKLYSLGGPRMAQQLRRIPDAGNAKVAARRMLTTAGVPKNIVENWKYVNGPLILQHALVFKFMQNPDLKEKLVGTGDALLAQVYEMDKWDATGCKPEDFDEWVKKHNGETIKFPSLLSHETMQYLPLVVNGKNMLGCILMKVRDQVKKIKTAPGEAEDPVIAALMTSLVMIEKGDQLKKDEEKNDGGKSGKKAAKGKDGKKNADASDSDESISSGD